MHSILVGNVTIARLNSDVANMVQPAGRSHLSLQDAVNSRRWQFGTLCKSQPSAYPRRERGSLTRILSIRKSECCRECVGSSLHAPAASCRFGCMPPPGRVLSCSSGKPHAEDAKPRNTSTAIAATPIRCPQEKNLDREEVATTLPQNLLVR